MPMSPHPRPVALGLALSLALLLGPHPARATRSAVLAPLGGLGVESLEIGKVQRWLEAALAGVAGYRWLSTPRLAKLLRQARLRHAGREVQARCLGAQGRQLGAELIISGEVGSLGGAFMVYLRLIETSGRVVRSANAVLEPTQAGLRDAVRSLAVQLLAPDRYTGALKVTVDVPNAWIYLDGRRLAKSPVATLPGLSPGTHALRITHEAYRDFVRFVTVGFDETAQVQVKLSAYPVRSEEMRLTSTPDETRPLADHELPWYRRWWALTTFGVVVLAATTAVVTVVAKRPAPRDAEVWLRP